MKHSRFTRVVTTAVYVSLAIAGVGFVSCKSDHPSAIQPSQDHSVAVSQARKPVLGSSEEAFRLVAKELDNGEIRLTPYARSVGLRAGSGMTGLPPGTRGEKCDSSGCVSASCPSKDESGITIMSNDMGGNSYYLGYCVDRYTGEVNAFNDEAFGLTMKGDHSAWKPL